jgi:hypothetical protein
LTSALDGGGWLTPRPGRFALGKRTGTHCIGGLVGPHCIGGWVGPHCIGGWVGPHCIGGWLGPHCIGGWVGPHCIGGWVGPKSGLDWCGKPRIHWNFFFSLSEFRLLFSVCSFAILIYFCLLFSLVPFVITVQHTTQTFMPPAGFELAIPASEQQHTLSLDHSATRIGGIRFLDLSAPSVSLYRLSSADPPLCVRCMQQYRHGRWWD